MVREVNPYVDSSEADTPYIKQYVTVKRAVNDYSAFTLVTARKRVHKKLCRIEYLNESIVASDFARCQSKQCTCKQGC